IPTTGRTPSEILEVPHPTLSPPLGVEPGRTVDVHVPENCEPLRTNRSSLATSTAMGRNDDASVTSQHSATSSSVVHGSHGPVSSTVPPQVGSGQEPPPATSTQSPEASGSTVS